MARDLFNRYIWLVDTVYRAGKITFEEINRKWVRTDMSGGVEIPLKTFHNHRKAVQEIFDINIECSKHGGYYYYIENEEDLRNGSIRAWLLNTFSVKNLIRESAEIKDRIILENIPSGQKFLAPVIEAMKSGTSIIITHYNFWKETHLTYEVEPYCVKVFHRRWYTVARNVRHDNLLIISLDRITELKPTDHKFSIPEDFSPEAFFYNSFGIIVDRNIPPTVIRIAAYGDKVKYFRSLPLHHSQKETETYDDYSVFEYYLSPTYDFRQELLSHGDEITVLSPAGLRNEIKSISERVLKKYK